jgi:uncharacterized protein YndB with AHSA1/START domain
MKYKDKITSEIQINAPIEKVWSILEDFENYGKWNHFCPGVETTKRIGDPFIMTVHMKPGKKPIIQKEVFSDYEPPHVVGWSLDWGIWLKTHRIQRLEERDGGTYYYTEDLFWGLLTPLVMALYEKDIQRGFDDVAKALKEESEKK